MQTLDAGKTNNVQQYMVQYIYHCSDIHIGIDKSRRQEYRNVFDLLAAEIQKNAPDIHQTILVIAGDIFHRNICAEDIEDFYYLLDALRFLPVFIIQGGFHDSLLAMLVSTRQNIYCLSGMQLYKYLNLRITRNLECDTNAIVICYGLLHEITNYTNFCFEKLPHLKEPTNAAIVLAGGIHDYRFISTSIAYCGSLIQHNRTESLCKGVILWNVQSASGKFVRIKNPYGYVHMVQDAICEDPPENILGLSISVPIDTPFSIVEKLTSDMRNRYNHVVDEVIYTGSKALQNITLQSDINVQEEVIRDILATTSPDCNINAICELHRSFMSLVTTKKQWYLYQMKWSNLLSYGENNVIDFTDLSGVTGIIAPNKSGKSSIIDILAFGLFNDYLRADRYSMHRVGTTISKLQIEFIVVDSKETHYIVERTDTLNKQTKVLLYETPPRQNITKNTNTETYHYIRSLIGSVDDFLATCACTQDNANDVIRINNKQRKEVLSVLFGLTGVDKIEKKVKAEYKLLKAQASTIQVPSNLDMQSLLLRANRIESQLCELYKESDDLINGRTKLLREKACDPNKAQLVNAISSSNNLLIEIEAGNSILLKNYEETKCEYRRHWPTGDIFEGSSENVVDIAKKIATPENLATEICAAEYIKCKNKLAQNNTERHDITQELLDSFAKSITLMKSITPTLNQLISYCTVQRLIQESFVCREFAVDCAACVSNREVAQSDLLEVISRIDDLYTCNKLIEAKNKETNSKLAELEKYRIKLISDSVRRATEENNELSAKLKYQAAIKNSMIGICKKIVSAKIRANELIQQIESKYKELDSLATTEKINAWKEMQVAINEKIAEVNKRIGATIIEQQQVAKDILILETYTQKYPTNRLNLLKTYLNVLTGKISLQLGIVKKNIYSTLSIMNSMLSTVADFTIDCRVGESKIDFTIVKLSRYGIFTLPIELGSGYQKFIISIIFRLAITHILQTAPQFIIIDEGLGCLDKTNSDKIHRLFAEIKKEYKWIMLLSHDTQLVLESSLQIVTGSDGNTITNKPTELFCGAE